VVSKGGCGREARRDDETAIDSMKDMSRRQPSSSSEHLLPPSKCQLVTD
jgi:hypothetical protein